MPTDVFVLGSFVADAAFRAARPPRPGETVLGSHFALGPGGKGSNQAVAAARAGAQVSLITAVGADFFGQIGRDLWQNERIETSRVQTKETPTGCAAILLDDASGENAIIVVPGACADLSPADVDASQDALAASKVFLAQLELPLAVVQRGLEVARGAGVVTVLNPAPAQPLPPELLGLVDFLIPNESEVATLTGLPVDDPQQAQAAVDRLLEAGCANVIVTLGAKGSLLCTPGALGTAIPSYTLGPTVDTTGAGDAFCGAFAAALAEGQMPAQAARFASAAAGCSVTRSGAALAMPDRGAIERALQVQR